MNRQTISLGRIFGIPIGLDYSWFLVFGLLTWTLAVSYYPDEFKDWPTVQYWVVGAVSEHITHLILRKGHLWGQKDVTIPVSEIARIEEDAVHLKLAKEQVEALPTIPVRRRYTCHR